MAKIALITGVLLIVLALGFFFATGAAHPTSLIPGGFGLLLLICGVVANTEDAKKRMLWMHIAVTVGLLGFLMTAFMGIKALTHWSTLAAVHQTAATEQIIMAVICAGLYGAVRAEFHCGSRGADGLGARGNCRVLCRIAICGSS